METITTNVEPKDAWSLYPTDILFQTPFWSEVKLRLGWKTHAFDYKAPGADGDILILTRHLGKGINAAYVQQGPENGPRPEGYGPFLEDLSETLVKHIGMDLAFIRYDLPWPSQYSGRGTQQQYPDGSIRPEPRLQEVRMNFGTRSWNLRKAAVDMTVADALVIDIAKSEEELLADMKPKTRYNVRLTARKGVEVVCSGVSELPAFYDLYCQTSERNRFDTCSYDHFSALYSALASTPDSSEVHFLLARHGKDILAGAIMTISGRTATYLFGVSSSGNWNLMAPYAVQWAAIHLARERGCLTYDMGAVASSPDPEHHFFGMHRFKTGFGGRIIHRGGTWDYPLVNDEYLAFRNFEMLGPV
jgi:lipid II:glycine glycyltransferase (peptidoglycan interpeptide bridge formation enzyme)